MNTKSISIVGAAALAAAILFAAPSTSQASDHWWSLHRHHHDREVYLSRPRSAFRISLGTGYAGRGYYYGPPDAGYYYERPGVTFYRTLAAVPREYGYRMEGGYRSEGTAPAVQRALARRGYYHGPIDGQIGPGSRRAIASYQAHHGLRATGLIGPSLLRSLHLD